MPILMRVLIMNKQEMITSLLVREIKSDPFRFRHLAGADAVQMQIDAASKRLSALDYTEIEALYLTAEDVGIIPD